MSDLQEPRFAPQPTRDEYLLSPGDVLRGLWRRIWVIMLVVIGFSGAAVGLTFTQTPVYEASNKVLVSSPDISRAGGTLRDELEGIQLMTETMAEAVSTRPVAKSVVERLDLQMPPEALLGGLNVEPVYGTQFIEISYTDSDPERAKLVVNTVASVVSQQMISKLGPEREITATLWEPAVTPGAPISPKPLRNGLWGLALGCMLGVGLALILEYRDDSWRSPEEAERISGVPTFGVIPAFAIVEHGREREA